MSELFATNVPDPHHWTLSSCFVAFRKVWVHLGPFRYCTKLGAKWAELVQLMQRFMPRSCAELFIMNAPDPHHWTLNSYFLHFVKFGCIWDRFITALNSVQMGQSGAINAKVRVTKSHLNFSLRTWPIHTIGP